MKFEMLYSKIHRAKVTDANLNYEGSITIDEDLMDAANIFAHQKVEILNVNNGERFTTYVIKGGRNTGSMCLNGAAARKAQIGDIIIVVTYSICDSAERDAQEAIIVSVDESNKIKSISKE